MFFVEPILKSGAGWPTIAFSLAVAIADIILHPSFEEIKKIKTPSKLLQDSSTFRIKLRLRTLSLTSTVPAICTNTSQRHVYCFRSEMRLFRCGPNQLLAQRQVEVH